MTDYSAWSKQGTWEVTENHPGTGNQARITVPYYTGMTTDFSDIRFTDSSNADIPYWIEAYTASTSATVWIKLSAATSGTLYYGNSDATSASSITDVMEFGDDFSAETIDTGKWTATGAVIENGVLKVGSDVNADSLVYAAATQGSSTILGMKCSIPSSATTNLYAGYGRVADYGLVALNSKWTSPYLYLRYAAASTLGIADYRNVSHKYEIIRNGSEVTLTVDGTIEPNTPVTGASTINLGAYFKSYNANQYIYVDYVYVRKYVATEPSFLLTEAESGSTQIYPIIEYNEDTEMFQISGTSKIHPVQIRSLTTGEIATTLTNTVCYYKINGGTKTTFTPTISAYDNDMTTFDVTIPDTLAVNAYDSVQVNISADEGDGNLMINIVPDPSTTGTTAQEVWEYATRALTAVPTGAALSSELTAIKGTGWTTETLVALNTAIGNVTVDTTGLALTTDVTAAVASIKGATGTETLDTVAADIAGISITGGSGGMGHIISTYTFDPTNDQITITEVGYTDVKHEQIISIFNATTGQWYYNSELRRYGAEPGKPWTKYFPLTSVALGVITYTAPDTSAAADDVLQIIVNKA